MIFVKIIDFRVIMVWLQFKKSGIDQKYGSLVINFRFIYRKKMSLEVSDDEVGFYSMLMIAKHC